MENKLLKLIPNINSLIKKFGQYKNDMPYFQFVSIVRNEIEKLRSGIKDNKLTGIDEKSILSNIENKLKEGPFYNFKRTINGTGTIVHTNLGRSILSEEAISHICEIASSYNNLEYNLVNQKRGSRYDLIEKMICDLTGAESAVVVNNNAGAVLLSLVALVHGGEAIVSRGELIEIGGSFRIPEIMKFSGTKLVEVGTTNRVHKKDYVENITKNTKAILKVHTSNFKIIGFTKELSSSEIVKIAQENNILAIEDAGSGNLLNLAKYANLNEPVVADSIKAGMDLVMFSGDKLLGGAQCGIIVGKRKLIDKIKKHNLIRALRVSKLALAALEVTLSQYMEETDALKKIPTLKMIVEKQSEVEKRVDLFIKKINNKNIEINKINTKALIGGGALPTETVDSVGITISAKKMKNNQLLEIMHKHDTPIIPRIEKNLVLLDFKTIFKKDMDVLEKFINKL